MSGCRLAGIPADARKRLVAERNKNIVRLVLEVGVPRDMVAARFGVSKSVIDQVVCQKKKATQARKDGC